MINESKAMLLTQPLVELFASLTAELINLSFRLGVMEEISTFVSGFTFLMTLAAFISSFATDCAVLPSEMSFAPACNTTACMLFMEWELLLADFSSVFLRVITLPPLWVLIFTDIFESDRILGLRTLVVSSPAMNTVIMCVPVFLAVVGVLGF